MKSLVFEQMENITAEGGGFWTAFACAGTVIAAGAFIAGTGGAGAMIGAYAAGFACGGLLGWGAGSGDFY